MPASLIYHIQNLLLQPIRTRHSQRKAPLVAVKDTALGLIDDISIQHFFSMKNQDKDILPLGSTKPVLWCLIHNQSQPLEIKLKTFGFMKLLDG